MEKIRTPYQGIYNILRFNWHFYALAFGFLLILIVIIFFGNTILQTISIILFTLIFITTLSSLIVSYYIYDYSDLYQFKWLENDKRQLQIVTISAGFDETSGLLQSKFPNSDFDILEFYNPDTHTEVSIARARKAYAINPQTKSISTINLGLVDNYADKIFVILAAHEIRNESERIAFFCELRRVLKNDGEIYIIEHLRDSANFLAYTLGFFHFLSLSTWKSTFGKANLKISKVHKTTPFISTFTLTKNGTSS